MTRLTQVMRFGLCGLVIVSAYCSPKPLPNGPDGRPCFPAVLTSTDVMQLRAAHPLWQIHAGDLIQTPECAKQDSADRLHALYELTR